VVKRPGYIDATAAISIAAIAALRTAAGSSPVPTRSAPVAASAATAAVIPPERKQSSTTRSSS